MNFQMKHFLILGACLAAAALQAQKYEASYSPVAPKMDGIVAKDPAWEKIPWTTERFRVFKTGVPAAVETRFKALYTDDALYLAFECMEPQMDKLKPEVNADEFWNFDVLEFFLFPRKGELMHLAVSSSGLTNQEMPGTVTKRTNFMTAWQGASKRLADRWTSEVCFPFYLLGLAPDVRPVELAFTVSRYATPSRQYSTWTYQKEALKSTEYYGRILFRPAPRERTAIIRRSLFSPHWLSLVGRWSTIRRDPSWKPILAENRETMLAIEKIYAVPVDYPKHSLELAELMAKIEKLAEKKAKAEERRMMKRFFEE